MIIPESVVVRYNEGDDAGDAAVILISSRELHITNSTFSNNTGFRNCVAFHANNAAVTVVKTTVSDNSTVAGGFRSGAICINSSSVAAFRNTTISGNTANGTESNRQQLSAGRE